MPLVPPRLPSFSDAVIYGSLVLSAAAVFAISFFGIVGTFYRTTNPLVPPTRALGASLLLLSPLAAALIAGGVLADRHYLSIADAFSPGLVLACLCGVPALLWAPAAVLTAWPAFRDVHMAPAPADAAAVSTEPEQSSSAATPAEPAVSTAAGGGRSKED